MHVDKLNVQLHFSLKWSLVSRVMRMVLVPVVFLVEF